MFLCFWITNLVVLLTSIHVEWSQPISGGWLSLRTSIYCINGDEKAQSWQCSQKERQKHQSHNTCWLRFLSPKNFYFVNWCNGIQKYWIILCICKMRPSGHLIALERERHFSFNQTLLPIMLADSTAPYHICRLSWINWSDTLSCCYNNHCQSSYAL